MNDILEFYDGNKFIASVESHMVPSVGSFISIRKKTWQVDRLTYALDYTDDQHGKRLRCNVDLVEPKP